MEYNLADLFENIVDAVGSRTAVHVEGRSLTYSELDKRANRLAHHFTSVGIGAGDHVGCHLMNGTEYVETMLALLKIRAVPINVNFRYVRDELRYLYDNADLVGLVYDTEFADRVAAVLPDVPRLRHLLAVGPGAGETLPYEQALAAQPDDRASFPTRSAGDLVIIYTGGTTGLPKGVMWRQDDLLFGAMAAGVAPLDDPADIGPRAAAATPNVLFAAPPLMHGTAFLATFITFLNGGKVCLVRKYSGDGAVRLIEEQGCQTMVIVGDAMATPIVEALDATPRDLPSFVIIASAGALLSLPVRERLRAHLPSLYIVDSFGSTETGHSGAATEHGLRFTVNDTTTVLGEDLRPVSPGSDVVGQVARRGHIALGYYGDPDKTARTFVEVDGVRWVLTGDLAVVEPDGTVRFLGRGSISINTGGEKVYPEEVEGALKSHPAITDAVVAGIPDPRWGQKVAAVLQLRPTAAIPTRQELEDHLAPLVARYKLPRFTHVVPHIQRSPSGKPDYRWATETLTKAAEHSSD